MVGAIGFVALIFGAFVVSGRLPIRARTPSTIVTTIPTTIKNVVIKN
jgi:hypothetical protein